MLLLSKIFLLFEKHNELDYKILNLVNRIIKRCYKDQNLKNYSKCYQILEIPDNSDQECVRKSFIKLCKKYHPDSGKPTANALKFREIEAAYRTLQNKFAKERWNINESIGEYGLYYKEKKEENLKEKPEVYDIKHTAPQHRQYLSYDGIGSGTPSQREKQYIKYRRAVVVENLYEHQIKKFHLSNDNAQTSLVLRDKTEAKKIKTRYGMERLVEDLIQESMAKGHFENLRGQGKPLPVSNYNPYVDFVTHKMNEILLDNGFTPEWITLQKEISDEITSIKEKLLKERKKLGPVPLSFSEKNKWEKITESLSVDVQNLNKKINKYNLLVPLLQKQKLYFNLEKESFYILQSESYRTVQVVKEENHEKKETKENLLISFFSLFK